MALSRAGLPVVLSDDDELRARLDGADYIGIVPHDTIPTYCSGLFPAECGHVVDFFHVFQDDLDILGDKIHWLPMAEAKLAGKT